LSQTDEPQMTGSLIVGIHLMLALVQIGSPATASAVNGVQTDQQTSDSLKRLSLSDLGNIEVTTASKEPAEVRRIPAAIYVITQEDIRRSGVTSLREALRLAPGVNVARIDSDHWSVGVRGLGDQFSKSVLVMIDGRSVYTPLFAGVFWSVQDTLASISAGTIDHAIGGVRDGGTRATVSRIRFTGDSTLKTICRSSGDQK
jgi:outer membrane receptor protein involved in Fe transport